MGFVLLVCDDFYCCVNYFVLCVCVKNILFWVSVFGLNVVMMVFYYDFVLVGLGVVDDGVGVVVSFEIVFFLWNWLESCFLFVFIMDGEEVGFFGVVLFVVCDLLVS